VLTSLRPMLANAGAGTVFAAGLALADQVLIT